MSGELVETIAEQTVILLHNVKICILTCTMDYVLCGMPIWKHVYHALHSCDQWFINPNRYGEEPPFHRPGLNSLNHKDETALSRETLLEYCDQVQNKVFAYLADLEDDALREKPEGCAHTRMALILGQYRHLCAHLGNINAATMIQSGNWPRVVGLEGVLSADLFE